MINKNLEKLIDLSKVKIRAERIALDLTQEEFSEFVDIKYATYKSFEQNGKISFENYIKILIKLNKDDQFLKFLNSFEFDEQKQRASSKKIDENSIINILIKPIIEVSQKQIVLDKKIFGEELFYSVEDGQPVFLGRSNFYRSEQIFFRIGTHHADGQLGTGENNRF
jgi:transcriptional regulator with XRE-family HTH domain